MDTVYVGVNGFANAASAEDDLGNGTMYAALIRQATLKRLGLSDESVATVTEGRISSNLTFGRSGAIIADTSDRGNIPMQLVCPVGFKANLSARIASATGKTLSTCTIGEFIDAFCYVSDNTVVSEWGTFISWLETQWRETMNSVIETATSLTMTTVDGDAFPGTLTSIPTLTKMSDLLLWVKGMMPSAMLAEDVESITSDNNPDKLGFTAHMETTYWLARSLTMQFYFRL